jgi:hypothetical protein
MRYYKPKFPEVDELVMVQVRQIAEMGAYVKLVSLCHSHFYNSPRLRPVITLAARV